jgi:hypothetical protein
VIRIVRDEWRLSQRVYINDELVTEVLDVQFMESVANRVGVAFAGVRDIARTLSFTFDDAVAAFDKLAFALMTKAQRRRWAKRFIREEVARRRMHA